MTEPTGDDVLRLLRLEIEKLNQRVRALQTELAREKRAKLRLQTLLDVMRLAS